MQPSELFDNERESALVAARYSGFGLDLSCTPVRVGLSGADIWMLRSNEQEFCLRRWPREHPTGERLQAIHAAVRFAALQGIPFLAIPIADRDGSTIVRRDGRLWELTPWLAGETDWAPETHPARVTNAFHALARLHLAWRDCGWRGLAVNVPGEDVLGVAPGLAARLEMAERLLRGELPQISQAVAQTRTAAWQASAEEILARFKPAFARSEVQLRQAAAEIVPRQVCLRDLQREHVLFVGDDVRGIIDYGAMRVDCVAADIARLATSWFAENEDMKRDAYAAYAAIRPLSAAEHRLISAYELSAILLTGVQWLIWLAVEGRTFADMPEITRRLEENARRIVRLAADGPPARVN